MQLLNILKHINTIASIQYSESDAVEVWQLMLNDEKIKNINLWWYKYIDSSFFSDDFSAILSEIIFALFGER